MNMQTVTPSTPAPEQVKPYQLIEGKYQQSDRSLAFSFLPITEIPAFIEQSKQIGQRSTVRLFKQKIKEILPSTEG